MSRCAVCQFSRVDHVDALVIAGQSLTSIAKGTGVPYDSLKRHVRNGHVKGSVASQAANVPMPSVPASGDVDPMADLQAQLKALDAIAATSPSMQLQVLEARRRVVAEIAKVAPPAKDAEGPSAKSLRVMEALFAVQNEVIDRYPEIRAAMATAIKEWKATRNTEEVR